MALDNRFLFLAISNEGKKTLTQENGVVFSGDDQALLKVLPQYRKELVKEGVSTERLQQVDELIVNMTEFQK